MYIENKAELNVCNLEKQWWYYIKSRILRCIYTKHYMYNYNMYNTINIIISFIHVFSSE